MPTNRFLQEKDAGATTYNKFFSIAVHEDVGEKLPAFDDSPFNSMWRCLTRFICQICMYWIRSDGSLKKILIIVIGTGDVKQLQGVEVMTNCQNPAIYIDSCIDIVFKYNTFLQLCKREVAKDSEEGGRNREIINNMYNDFWEDKLPLQDIIPKYVEITDDIMASEHNIAYTNIRCRNVANELRNKFYKKTR